MTYIRPVVPIKLIVHPPKSNHGKEGLAQRVAELHADMAVKQINSIKCSAEQKNQLIDRLMAGLELDHQST